MPLATVTSWLWFVAVALVPNALALLLLVAGLRATTARGLARLQKRAIACVVVTGLSAGLCVVSGGVAAFRAMHGDSIDPSQKARVLAEGISEVMNGIALGILATPLPLAAAIVIAVRAKRP